MKISSSILGGLAGATILTILHESVRRVNKDAPRMDRLGMEAIEKTLHRINADVPDEGKLFKITMAGDIISNTLYYSLVGLGGEKQIVLRGALLGLAAGIGGVYLPKPLGLNNAHSSRTAETKLLTIAWYTIGGLVTGIATKLIQNKGQA
jgi:hypothetical protein